MDYRELGRSGLTVSAFGLGVMTFGGQTPEADALRQLDMAFDAGVTLFDSAENYPIPTGPETQGRSEEVLGRWIADRGLRDRVVVATKVAGPGNAAGDMTHIRGGQRRLDRANIRQACEDSLRRLGTDRIDLYQLHWPERAVTTLGRSRFSLVADAPGQVAIEETLAALGELVAEGKVRAIGVCNESPWGAMRFLAEAERAGLPRIAAVQNGYSLLDRYYELGLAEIGLREGLGLLAYSPLARGTLTAKYRNAAPEGQSASFAARMLSENRKHAIAAYADLASAHGLEPAHMALAFARQQPFMGAVLMAASSVDQLRDNLRAVDLSLPKEVIQAINAIHDANPNPK
ncbi:aldo/keto reductase [Novosphingobium sp. JCM 18896]|uniref:aldo/keto reductase n=1 Tax=Novosphingobium sp. JCM 18896 TaxID=2989731 RepID=UPI0022220035|nr:aldo/keto reductase [Novosphingobium sp. JCM 18896]MCW1431758.1 aldo/keto reductase [Novosphingobium sp. JCM 18896]